MPRALKQESTDSYSLAWMLILEMSVLQQASAGLQLWVSNTPQTRSPVGVGVIDVKLKV